MSRKILWNKKLFWKNIFDNENFVKIFVSFFGPIFDPYFGSIFRSIFRSKFRWHFGPPGSRIDPPSKKVQKNPTYSPRKFFDFTQTPHLPLGSSVTSNHRFSIIPLYFGHFWSDFWFLIKNGRKSDQNWPPKSVQKVIKILIKNEVQKSIEKSIKNRSKF